MRRWGGWAFGVLLAGAAIGLARLRPAEQEHDLSYAPANPAPVPTGPIEPAGEAQIYRALLLRERGDRYGAFALGRAIASGAAGAVAAEHARSELLSDPPPMTLTIPLSEHYREVRFDERGRVEAIGPAHRTLFDPESGEAVRHVERHEQHTPVADNDQRSLKARVSEDWRALAQRDRQRQRSRRQLRVQGSRVGVYEGNERIATIDAPEGMRVKEAALSADGSVVCIGSLDGEILLQEVGSETPSSERLVGSITAIAPVPSVEGEAPAFLVGTRTGAIARVKRGPERDRYGHETDDGPIVVQKDTLARAGPAVRWLDVDANGATVAMDAEGLLRWGLEMRLSGVTIEESSIARRVARWKPSARLAAALDPEGGRIAVLNGDTLRLMSLEPGLPLCPVSGADPRATVWAARDDGRVVLQSGETNAVCDVDAPGAPLAILPVPAEDRRYGGHVRLTPDGRRLVVRGRSELRLIDVASGERVASVRNGEWVSPDGSVAIVRDRLVSAADGSALEPDCMDDRQAPIRRLHGNELFAIFEEQRLRICELDEDGGLVFETERYEDLPGPADPGGVGTSADGSHLWLGTHDGKVRLFELPSGRLVRTLQAGESGLPWATVANGGAYVMTNCRGRQRLFVVTTGEQVLELEPGPRGTDGPGAAPETFTGDGEYYVRIPEIRANAQTAWVSATGVELPVDDSDWDYSDIEVRGQAGPLGSGPDVVADSGHGTAIFRATPDGLRALMRVRAGPTAVVQDGRFIVWWGDSARMVPVGRSGPEAAELTAPLTNHRVCRGSFDPVVVPPSEIDDPIWAPASLCD